MKHKSFIIGLALFLSVVLAPAGLALAQGDGGGSANNPNTCIGNYQANKTLGGLFTYLTCLIITSVIPLVYVIGIVLFLWGVVQMMLNPTDEEKRSKGKTFMLWGIIALTVMFTVNGLMTLLGTTFDIGPGLPQLPTAG